MGHSFLVEEHIKILKHCCKVPFLKLISGLEIDHGIHLTMT